jgi:hypothetical protein
LEAHYGKDRDQLRESCLLDYDDLV